MPLIATSLPALLLVGLLGAGPANHPGPLDHPGIELRYHGSLGKASRDGETTGEPAKRFDLYCLATPLGEDGRNVTFVLDEHGGGGWAWPARFGRVTTDAKGHPSKLRIRLLHEHDGQQYVLFVPFPFFEFADRLAKDARWEAPRESEFANQRDSAPWKYRVASSSKVGSHNCWRVDVTNNFGPQESVWIDKTSGLLAKAERRIVLGRGETYLLRTVLDSVTPLNVESLNRVRRPVADLLRLQEALKRSDDDKSPDLTEAQLGLAAAAIKSLEQQAEGTPFDQLVAAIGRDVNSQSRRSGDVESLAKRFIGKPVPALQLKALDGEAIPATEHAGKIVLLHFWSYEGEPFPPEPYGQIGFLDYLYHRRNKLGLEVYGVAVDRRLADKTQAPAVLRSIKKLQGFMNLSYPLAIDDGTLLEKFGDPERVGAKLPLWVLIDPSGTVVEYKVGHYDIKAETGLSQLDKKVIGLIRTQRANRAKK
jgi:alkyl hydroperoxide reductase subunit AhpC